MTAAELRAALKDVPDDTEIIVRCDHENDATSGCTMSISCGLEQGCSDEPFFAIDADMWEDEEEESEES